MKNSEKLKPVANLAKQKEHSAARLHGSALRECQQQQQQLDELSNYRNQYIASFQKTVSAGMPIGQMRDYQLFISRLDQAIAQQSELVMQCQGVSENSQANLKDKQGRRKMINKVVASRKKKNDLVAERREQRESEDRRNSAHH